MAAPLGAAPPQLGVVFCGHTGSGKTTALGQLLVWQGGLLRYHEQRAREAAAARGDEHAYPTMLAEQHPRARKHGGTFDMSASGVRTQNHHCAVIDTPGNPRHLKSTIRGTSIGDVAVLFVPGDFAAPYALQKARKGRKSDEARPNQEEVGDEEDATPALTRVDGRTEGSCRRISRILRCQGVTQLIVCVTKLDSVRGIDMAERFEDVRDEVKVMLRQTGWKEDAIATDVAIIPASPRDDVNITSVATAPEWAWWRGQRVRGGNACVRTLLEAIDAVPPPLRTRRDAPLRFAVCKYYRIPGVGHVVTGRVLQGTVAKGDTLRSIGHAVRQVREEREVDVEVRSMEAFHELVGSASEGDYVGLCLRRPPGESTARRWHSGEVFRPAREPDTVLSTIFAVHVQVVHCSWRIGRGYRPRMFAGTGIGDCNIRGVNWRIHDPRRNSVRDAAAEYVEQGDIAEVVVEGTIPVAAAQTCEPLGRVILMDGRQAAMLGKVAALQHQ